MSIACDRFRASEKPPVLGAMAARVNRSSADTSGAADRATMFWVCGNTATGATTTASTVSRSLVKKLTFLDLQNVRSREPLVQEQPEQRQADELDRRRGKD